jgi:hypothetical protein
MGTATAPISTSPSSPASIHKRNRASECAASQGSRWYTSWAGPVFVGTVPSVGKTSGRPDDLDHGLAHSMGCEVYAPLTTPVGTSSWMGREAQNVTIAANQTPAMTHAMREGRRLGASLLRRHSRRGACSVDG